MPSWLILEALSWLISIERVSSTQGLFRWLGEDALDLGVACGSGKGVKSPVGEAVRKAGASPVGEAVRKAGALLVEAAR